MVALAALDDFGMPAYECAADRTGLEPVPDAPGVLQCPKCGHRTDARGEGVLADGFDVLHRQWGLRADPHAWAAMRDLVGAVPTPPVRSAIRSAYVDALRRVADVDIDTTSEDIVYRKHLDHGGMSGGGVNVTWWRTKGITLLVDRADQRRPSALPPSEVASPASTPRRGAKQLLVDVVVWAVIIAIPASLIGGGGFLLYQRGVGTRVEVTVLGCALSGGVFAGAASYREDCAAEWTIDGETVVGSLSGGSGGWSAGERVDATVRGDTAYARSLGLPVLLIALGLPFLALPVLALRPRRARGG